MRLTYFLTVAAAICIPVFSAPVSRQFIKRSLFANAIKFSKLGDSRAVAAQIGNLIGGPPEVCTLVSYLFGKLQEGESLGGVTTVGDRAVAGMRKMLGLQNLSGDAGVTAMMETLLSGPDRVPPKVLRALQDLVANPEKTIASLKAYKYLIDTRDSLQVLIDTTKRVDGDPSIPSTVSTVVLPIMKKMEGTIDKIGGDFSVQTFNPQDVTDLLSTLDGSADKIKGLRALNKSFAGAVTAQLDVIDKAFENLSTSIKTASAIPDSARKIPVEAFKVRNNSCKPIPPPASV